MVEAFGGLCLGILAGWLILYGIGLVAAWAWIEVRLICEAAALAKELMEE